MSEPKPEPKLRGGKPSQLTQLKIAWRGLSEDARDYWRALFISETTQAEVRRQVAAKLQIKLSYDKQLNQFRKWLAGQDALDNESEQMADDERRLKEQFGDTLSLDEIRERVLKASYARTMASGDFHLGLNTVKADLKNKEVTLDKEKFAVECCKKFLEWFEDKKARAIAESPSSNADKIEQLGRAMFGEDWRK